MRTATIILVAVLLAGGCGWRSGAAKTLSVLTVSGERAHVLILERCGHGGTKAVADCIKRKDAACRALASCETATRALHTAAVAVLLAKVAVGASDRPGALTAVAAALRAWRHVEATLKGWIK